MDLLVLVVTKIDRFFGDATYWDKQNLKSKFRDSYKPYFQFCSWPLAISNTMAIYCIKSQLYRVCLKTNIFLIFSNIFTVLQ